MQIQVFCNTETAVEWHCFTAAKERNFMKFCAIHVTGIVNHHST